MKLTITHNHQDPLFPQPNVSIEVPDESGESIAEVINNLVIPAIKAMGYNEHLIQTYFNTGAIEAEMIEVNKFFNVSSRQ